MIAGCMGCPFFNEAIQKQIMPSVLPEGREHRSSKGRRASGCQWLLTRAVLDHLFDFLLYRLEVERRRVLHRWVFDCSLRQLPHRLLNQDEAPELAGEEVVAVAESTSVGRLAANHRRTLERVLTKVNHARHVGGDLFARPAIRLLIERELEVVVTKCAQAGTAEIEDFVALGWAFAGDKIRLIVAIEMVLVRPVAELHAPEKLLGDVRVVCGGQQSGKPVEAGDKSVLDGARLDPARPADDTRHAEAALTDGALGVLERGHAAIRPGEHLRA